MDGGQRRELGEFWRLGGLRDVYKLLNIHCLPKLSLPKRTSLVARYRGIMKGRSNGRSTNLYLEKWMTLTLMTVETLTGES